MTDITKLVKNLRHWANMASLTSEQVSCLSVPQLETIANELDSAHQLIAELESFRTAYMEWSDKTDWVQTDKRFYVVKPLGKHRADVLKAYIEHLESRTVKLPKPISVLHRRDFTDAHRSIYAYPEAELNAALDDAGIKVEGE